jgi:3-oxoadipate enol-lactonase
MQFRETNGVVTHFSHRAGGDGRCPILFLNSLGTDLRIWNDVVARLPVDIPVLRMDKRGHGLTDIGPIDIPTLAADAVALMESLGVGPALVCGVSVGGMIAQQIAIARPDLVRALVLSNTGARIGTAEVWNERIQAVTADGIEPMAGAILERWFSKAFRDGEPEQVGGYRNMLCRTTVEGYAGVSAAIRDTDLSAAVASIAVPALCVSGSEDLATPVDVVAALAEAITVARLVLEAHAALG